jgi:hypothetical protein
MRDPNPYGRHLREVVERHRSLPRSEQRIQIHHPIPDRSPQPSQEQRKRS